MFQIDTWNVDVKPTGIKRRKFIIKLLYLIAIGEGSGQYCRQKFREILLQ